MDDNQIKVGDIVRLKSGSPNMTVNEPRSGGSWNCKWQDFKTGKICSEIFHENALKKCPPESPTEE